VSGIADNTFSQVGRQHPKKVKLTDKNAFSNNDCQSFWNGTGIDLYLSKVATYNYLQLLK